MESIYYDVTPMPSWLAVEAVRTWPNYLPYFNEFAGGSRNGYRHLVDSSSDWGQDLSGVRPWLAAHGVTENATNHQPAAYFSYFGSAWPTYYRIPATMLPSFFDERSVVPYYELKPGYYCISTTMIESEPNAPDSERLYREARDEFRRIQAAPPSPQECERQDEYGVRVAI